MRQVFSFFSSASKMIAALAPLDISIALDLSVDFLPVALAGALRIQLEATPVPMIAVSASVSVNFLGIYIEGSLEISTTGGVEYAHIEGGGETAA